MATTKLNIDLGSNGGPDYPPAMTSPGKEKYYPRFCYSGEEELGLPKEGTMVIRYREVASSNRENRDDSETYTCEIEVQEIISVDGSASVAAPAKSYGKDTEDALDALRKPEESGEGE